MVRSILPALGPPAGSQHRRYDGQYREWRSHHGGNGADGGLIDTGNRADTVANVTLSSLSTSTISGLNVTGLLSITAGSHDGVNSSGTLTTQAASITGNGVLVMGANATDSTWIVGTGGLTLNNGNVKMGNPGGVGKAQVTLQGNVTASGTNLFDITNSAGVRIIDLNGESRTWSINSGTTTTEAGLQNGGVAKTGAGTFLLLADSTYAGGTTVTAGTLMANNSAAAGSATGTGNVDVSGTGRLGGNGRVNASATGATFNVASGGTLIVGQNAVVDAQRLQVGANGAITLAGLVSMDLTGGSGSGVLNGNTGNNDQLALTSGSGVIGVSGILQINTNIAVTAGSWTAGSAWQLFQWSSVTGEFSNLTVAGAGANGNPTLLPDLAPLNLKWDWSQLYSTGVLRVVVIPEPGREMMVMMALGSLVLRRRRGVH